MDIAACFIDDVQEFSFIVKQLIIPLKFMQSTKKYLIKLELTLTNTDFSIILNQIQYINTINLILLRP